ncbi:MAG TPA: hypothetical protein VJN93_08845 [Candidatus Acidoferrum sp.]|nr:hypothetical protein [Candidatus Acidoferrum sp.]
MNFLVRVVRFLFWVLVISWGVALLRGAARWLMRDESTNAGEPEAPGAANEEGKSPMAGRRLVRDPVCGMHVAEELAIPLSEGGEMVHFCSEECREKYLQGARRMAANG